MRMWARVDRWIRRWARDLLSNERTLWSGRPPNTELLHPRAQGAFIESQLLGGIAAPFDLPAARLEHGEDVLVFDVPETCRGRSVGLF